MQAQLHPNRIDCQQSFFDRLTVSDPVSKEHNQTTKLPKPRKSFFTFSQTFFRQSSTPSQPSKPPAENLIANRCQPAVYKYLKLRIQTPTLSQAMHPDKGFQRFFLLLCLSFNGSQSRCLNPQKRHFEHSNLPHHPLQKNIVGSH